MFPRHFPRWQFVLLIALLISSLPLPTAATPAPTQQPAPFQIFLPLTRQPAAQPSQPVAPFFMSGDAPTRHFDAVYDASGGLHMTFIRHSQQAGGQAVNYGYCAPTRDCQNQANWQTAAIRSSTFGGTEIAVTSDGKPRLLYEPENTTTHSHIAYAECNRQCTNPANWREVYLSIEPLEYATIFGSMRRDLLALTADNQPRVLIPIKGGTYFSQCASACLTLENWSFTLLAPRISDFQYLTHYDPVLRIGNDGRYHLVSHSAQSLYYLTCAGACNQTDDWTATQLSGPADGQTPTGHMDLWATNQDLEIGAQGQLVLAAGGYRLSNPNEPRLEFATCASDCSDLANWQGWGAAAIANQLELGLGPDDRPYFSIAGKRASDGEGITVVGWCRELATCYASTGAQWTDKIVDTQSAMEREYPMLPNLPTACSPLTFEWSNNGTRLLIAPDGTPQLWSTSIASATCVSGYKVERDPWGVIRSGRGVDIWFFTNRARLIPVSPS